MSSRNVEASFPPMPPLRCRSTAPRAIRQTTLAAPHRACLVNAKQAIASRRRAPRASDQRGTITAREHKPTATRGEQSARGGDERQPVRSRAHISTRNWLFDGAVEMHYRLDVVRLREHVESDNRG